MSQSTAKHRQAAQGETADCAVLTVSDTRTLADDTGGQHIVDALVAAGHGVVARALVRDEPALIRAQLERFLEDPRVEVILSTGGTGISSRDTTIEVVESLLDKRLDGFGELFRMLSFAEIGAAAMLSRATAGLRGETLIFAMPGSPHAVALAMSRLIIPELSHLVWERRR